MPTMEQRKTNAFQFKPKELEGMSEEQIQDTIARAMNHQDGMAEGYVMDGRLRVALYLSMGDSPFFRKYHVSLRPGQWLTIDYLPTVVSNSQMRMQRFEAAVNRIFGK